MKIKMMYNGIKVGGKLYRGWFAKSGYVRNGSVCNDTITFYAKSSTPNLPRKIGLYVENDSDITTDYFDNDRVHFAPEHNLYQDVLAAWKKAEIRRSEKVVKNETVFLEKWEKLTCDYPRPEAARQRGVEGAKERLNEALRNLAELKK